MKLFWRYTFVVVAFFIYACTTILTKLASMQELLSWQYILCVCGAVGVLGVYAVLWQQIIKRMSISNAYMFKGTGLIWTMLFCYFLFNEPITVKNGIGAAIIIAGITLYAWADGRDINENTVVNKAEDGREVVQ